MKRKGCDSSDSGSDDDSDDESSFKKKYKLVESTSNYPWVVVPLPSSKFVSSPATFAKLRPDMTRYKFLMELKTRKISFEPFPSDLAEDEKGDLVEDELKEEEKGKFSWDNDAGISFNVINFQEKIIVINKDISLAELEPFIWSLYFYLFGDQDYDGDKKELKMVESKYTSKSFLNDPTVEWCFAQDWTADETVGSVNENIMGPDFACDSYASIHNSVYLNLERNGGTRPFICYTIGVFCYKE
jgi:hypothetical protein